MACGAKRDTYQWSQTLREVDVEVFLPPNIHSTAQLIVRISDDRLNVTTTTTNADSLLSGRLRGRVDASTSCWTRDGGVLQIFLEKRGAGQWWDALFDEDSTRLDVGSMDKQESFYDLQEDERQVVRRLVGEQVERRRGDGEK